MITPLVFSQTIKRFEHKHFQGQICLSPFVSIEVDVNGHVRLCGCQPWMPTTIGNVFEQSIQELLASPLAQEIRHSIIDGSYVFCDETKCGIIANNALNSQDNLPPAVEWQTQDASRWQLPHEIFIAGDLTCNLSCPSCRTHVIASSDQDIERQNQLGELLRLNLFSHPTTQSIRLHVSTSGEIFASARLLAFVSSISTAAFPNLRLHIQTNGLLMPARWSRLGDMCSQVDKITITVDAAKADTYEKLRRGGSWSAMIQSLAWARDHCDQNQILLHLRMVVQNDNWSQMQEFYDMAMLYNADQVEYSRISNWGTFTAQQFGSVDVFDKNHVDHAQASASLVNIRQLPKVFVSGGL